MYHAHTHLFAPPGARALLVSGPHLQVLSPDGAPLHSTSSGSHVLCAAMDAGLAHAVTVGEDKRLRVWALDGLRLLSERELQKRPTKVLFARDQATVLVADKFGDVHSYPLHPPPASKKEEDVKTEEKEKEKEKDEFAAHNPAGGTLVLGHVSLLTAAILSTDGRYILTADRDEHIRVSWYPQGYVIEAFCLGHTKFVSAIHIPSFAPSVLLSGGGDAEIYTWDWLSGKHTGSLPILDAVRPYIAVRAAKRAGHGDEEDGDGGEGEDGKPKKRGRKGRGKYKGAFPPAGEKAEKDGDGDAKMEGASDVAAKGSDDEGEKPQADGEASGSSKPAERPEPVLVLRRIQTLEADGAQLILFNAVGATAIFWAPFSATSADAVRAHDLGAPVLDVVPAGGTRFWVLLDAQWRDPAAAKKEEDVESGPAVKLVQVAPEKITEITDSPLLAALNTTCLIAVPDGAPAAPDLYADIVSMPKNTEVTHDPMAPDAQEAENAKEAGKRRTRAALAAAAQGGAGEPDAKRAKSEPGPGA